MPLARADLNRRMKEFEDRCRGLGLSVTLQRLAIFRALLQLDGHPSPDDVYQLVHRAYPSISLATVYKTLERLERAGLIAKANLLHETVRYEPRVDHHHHLVCVRCKRLEDVGADDLSVRLPRAATELGLSEAARREFEVLDFSITFTGVCRPCAAKEDLPPDATPFPARFAAAVPITDPVATPLPLPSAPVPATEPSSPAPLAWGTDNAR